ncbi:putative integral membrane protein conserved region-domain-containing protein [Pilaira anomala]|nr:putative integral membrane protein conserved region-domain-containing protein [Pilaira anomala]
MIQFKEIIVVYLAGGVTFLPLILIVVYFTSSSVSTLQNKKIEEKCKNPSNEQGKKGWIQLTKIYKPKGSSESNVAVLMSGIQSYVQGSKRQKEHVYAQLKCGALFIYETDQLNEDCKIIIPIHNYHVSIYPESNQDHDIFGRSVALKLTPKKEIEDGGSNMEILDGDVSSPYLTSNNELFITCARPVDKEDWYFGLLAATDMMTESPSHVEMMDITHFDLSAMQKLISTVQQDAEYREVQWLNAILGRLFLGLYKTEEMRLYFQEKISKKTQKIKRPSFLGEISVQNVDIGNSIPFVTQPKLLSLTPEGDLMAEATVHYAGGLQVVIQTDFNWNYSSLMKPIRVPLVLSVTLKKLSGKLLLKVKPPPTNRYWIAFYEMPEMNWEITPIVSDKQIRLSMVTNAIQSKIREFMMENIVLPNMDDFSFCPSGGKGGIFGELVPKPSSPKETFSSTIASSSTPSMDLDMLGNKINHNVIPPKVVVTNPHDSFDLLQNSLPKPPTRRTESLGILESSVIPDQTTHNRRTKSTSADSKHLVNSSSIRSRGYSNPDILFRKQEDSSNSNDKVSSLVEEKGPLSAVEEIPIATPSFTRRLSTNLAGFRKRSPPQQEIVNAVEDTPSEPLCSNVINDIQNTIETSAINDTIIEGNKLTINLEQQEKEEEEEVTKQILLQQKNYENFDDDYSITSNKSSANSSSHRTNLLSKLTSNVTKISSVSKINSKKTTLYTMAGSIFNKKNANKVTKEMKDERNRELQESHNRKMMNLFINNEPLLQKKQPPPLPPRRQNIPVVASLNSLSSDDDEEEASSPVEQVHSTFKQPTEVVIINQEHGLSI